jgi:hypothetical protein
LTNRLFRDAFLEKSLDNKTGHKTSYHPQRIALYIRPANQLAKQVLDDIHRFQPVGKIGNPTAHMLLVDIILVLQVAYRFP